MTLTRPLSPDGRSAGVSMYSPLSAIIRREPVTVALAATVREALETMDRARVGAIVVEDRPRRIPLGIFTLRDLVRRVAFPGGDLQQPVASVMTSGLIMLRAEATAHQAALAMARNEVRHVVVVDGFGQLVGVVSQGDLYAVQRVGVKEASDEIRRAGDVEGLRRAARTARDLTDALLARGTAAETLTQYLSTLGDLLTIRAIELSGDEIEAPTVPFCWMALGAQGRFEQTPSTDQDNAIVFDAAGADPEDVRRALLPFARAVNEKLDACGFRMCSGQIMASNPRWCLTLAEWQAAFSRWMEEPEPQALLNAATFFDLRSIHGAEPLAERLRERMLPVAVDHPLFLRLMAENAVRAHPPLGRIRDFVYERCEEFPHSIDLKKAARAFVDVARVVALAKGLAETSTAQRLRAAWELGDRGEESYAAAVDGFHFIHLLRLRNQCRPGHAEARANRVDPRSLNELERHVLKEAFRQGRKLQQRLMIEFRL